MMSRNKYQLFHWGGVLALFSLGTPRAPARTPRHIFEIVRNTTNKNSKRIRKPRDLLISITLHTACQPRNAIVAFQIGAGTNRSSDTNCDRELQSSFQSYLQTEQAILHRIFSRYFSDNSGMIRHPTRTHVTRRCQERHNWLLAWLFLVWWRRISLDIVTTDVSQLELVGRQEHRWNLLGNTERMRPIVVTISEPDNFGHIQPYLGSSVYDCSMCDSKVQNLSKCGLAR